MQSNDCIVFQVPSLKSRTQRLERINTVKLTSCEVVPGTSLATALQFLSPVSLNSGELMRVRRTKSNAMLRAMVTHTEQL